MARMKGITPIISIIVLLLIMVALAGAAWTYISGFTSAYTSKVMTFHQALHTSTARTSR